MRARGLLPIWKAAPPVAYGPVIIAEVPTLTILVSGVVGYFLKRALDKLTAEQTATRNTLTSHTDALATQSQALAVMVERQKPVDIALRDLQEVTRRHDGKLSNLEQTTAVLAQVIEDHKDHHPGPYHPR